jgi:hypothetical protein
MSPKKMKLLTSFRGAKVNKLLIKKVIFYKPKSLGFYKDFLKIKLRVLKW